MSSVKNLWQLDDAQHWHSVSAATLEHANVQDENQEATHWNFRGFIYSHDLFYGLDECLSSHSDSGSHCEQWPQIILMDYYLIDERGDHVTTALRQYLSLHTDAPHITIIGHSSVRSCSQHICNAGADSALIKREGPNGINTHLLKYLASYCDHPT